MNLPELNAGELNAGLIMEGGKPHHWLILLPEDYDDAEQQAAVDWAKSVGGELPTRREQSLLYSNLKSQFKPTWYWSGELNASDPQYAWLQFFGDGYQDDGHVSSTCRARAVRRLPI